MSAKQFTIEISQHKLNGMYAVDIEENGEFFGAATCNTIADCKEYIFMKLGNKITLEDIKLK